MNLVVLLCVPVLVLCCYVAVDCVYVLVVLCYSATELFIILWIDTINNKAT